MHLCILRLDLNYFSDLKLGQRKHRYLLKDPFEYLMILFLLDQQFYIYTKYMSLWLKSHSFQKYLFTRDISLLFICFPHRQDVSKCSEPSFLTVYFSKPAACHSNELFNLGVVFYIPFIYILEVSLIFPSFVNLVIRI